MKIWQLLFTESKIISTSFTQPLVEQKNNGFSMRQISKLISASFCILFLMCTISRGQVKIKERVEIAPAEVNLQKAMDNVTADSYTIRFELDWDKPQYNAVLFVELPSHYGISTGWQSGGNLEIMVNQSMPKRQGLLDQN